MRDSLALAASAVTEHFGVESDRIVIRGKALALDALLGFDVDDAAANAGLRQSMASARPFAHLALDGLFGTDLLDAIVEEFGEDREQFRVIDDCNSRTLRSRQHGELGPATQAYVDLVHSHRFVRWLSAITGVDNLIVDHGLTGGGLHETVRGGHFQVHRDFERHRLNGLTNAMVMITYLNHDWDESFGGALELWDAERQHCVRSIAPDFGRTVLLRHGDSSFHGHPDPLSAPPGRPRRSIAVYYYVNPGHDAHNSNAHRTLFLRDAGGPLSRLSARQRYFLGHSLGGKARLVVRDLMPPILWRQGKALARRLRKRDRSRLD